MAGAKEFAFSEPAPISRAAQGLEGVQEKFRDQAADQLNVASRKRLEIAKALAMDPEVVLFDEVMAGLNPAEIDTAVELILRIRSPGNIDSGH